MREPEERSTVRGPNVARPRRMLAARNKVEATLGRRSLARYDGGVMPARFQAPADLRAFLDVLRRENELVEITAPVDPDLEVAEVHRRVIAAGGPALLFRTPRGADFPLVTNLFGTARRVELAFGSRPEELVAQAARVPDELLPPRMGALWKKRGLLGALARVGLSRRRGGPVTEVVQRPPRLTGLPATKSWQRDGGRFITLPLVYTEHPATRGSNLGMYRIQIFDDTATGLHVQIGKGGGFHLAAWEERGEAMPVVINVGGPPAAVLGAIAPLPENVPELLLASLALGRRLPLAEHDAASLPALAGAEFAIVGSVAPGARRPEGPFGDHYGYYSEVHDYPLVQVDALLHRRDAILPATVVGKPRQEDFFLGDYLQELLAPLIRVAMPTVLDLWSYGETGYHALSAAIVRERYKREAMVSAFRILGEGQLSLTKFLLLTDRPVDLRDFRATLTHVLERADFRTDLFLFPNLSMDSLDYAGARASTRAARASSWAWASRGASCRASSAERRRAPSSTCVRSRPAASSSRDRPTRPNPPGPHASPPSPPSRIGPCSSWSTTPGAPPRAR